VWSQNYLVIAGPLIILIVGAGRTSTTTRFDAINALGRVLSLSLVYNSCALPGCSRLSDCRQYLIVHTSDSRQDMVISLCLQK
jgi:hypothetical protein